MAREMDVVGGEFTRSWFRNRNLSTFREYVYPEFHERPTLYLELGTFEGMSMMWMLQNALKHAGSLAVFCDPFLMTTKLDTEFMESVMDRALRNLSPWLDSGKLQYCRASSAEALRKMCGKPGFLGISKNTVDICMVDGNHNSLAVLDDLIHVTKLVKVDGWILLDDVENDRPKKDHVREGLTMWLERDPPVKLAWKHKYVECYQKTVI